MNRQSIQLMKRRWQRFAQDDAMFYIATRDEPWNREAFFAGGARLADDVMAWLGPDAPRRRMLEIGCGLGRTAVHFARHFEHVLAVDISESMIEQARAMNPPANVRFEPCSGGDLSAVRTASGSAGGEFDLVASFLVFQHIGDEGVIAHYLSDIVDVLSEDGRAMLQFDTRPKRFLIEAYKSLPDALLPRAHRHCIRRYCRDPQRLEEMFQAAGLRVIDERGVATAEHVFLLTTAGKSGIGRGGQSA